jgi:hypothetical protein
MTEQLKDKLAGYEGLLQAPEHQALPTPEKAEPLRADEPDPQERLKAARQDAEQSATRDNPLERLETAEAAPVGAQPRLINRQLKQITLRRELQLIRRALPLPQRTLSRLIHQPILRVTSEAAGRTVSRPSGLLGGGLTAFVGTSAYLYLAKQLGFTYNYAVFLALFIGGFFLGLILELLVHLVLRNRRATD